MNRDAKDFASRSGRGRARWICQVYMYPQLVERVRNKSRESERTRVESTWY